MRATALRTFVFGGMMGLALASGAAADPFQLDLDFRVAGIKAGRLLMKADAPSEKYKTRVEVTPSTLVDVFIDFSFVGVSQGWMTEGGQPRAARYDARSTSPDETRVTEIIWTKGVPSKVSVEPPRSTSPDPSKQAGTLDPVAAGFALVRDRPASEVCDMSVEVFDGSRRSRLSLGKPKTEGGRVVCDGKFQRLEGEEHTMTSKKQDVFRVAFDVLPDGMARLWRIETSTKFGKAVLERKGS